MKRTKKKKNWQEKIQEQTIIKGNHANLITTDFREPTILANDPSFMAWGWVVVNMKGEVLKHGCIKTVNEAKKKRIRVGDDRTRRTSEINKILIDIIKRYNVKYIVSELPHGSQNASAAVMLGITVGVMQTLADSFKLGVEWYSEQDAKKFLTGKKSASKAEMKNEIKKHYDVLWTNIKYKDEAVADALAVYHVAQAQSPTIKFMKNA